ncbi:Protein SRC2 homolog [Linum grandiflorum]
MGCSSSYDPFELEVTIVSAKHLKNVNWKSGDLKPYAVIYLDNSDHKLATNSDDYGSTRPVWNERFTLPVTRSISDSVLTLEILHSIPSETPKPLVGAVKIPLSQILDSNRSPTLIHDIELIRPSGRPQGKARLKLTLKESPPPPPPSPRPPIPPPPPTPVFPQVKYYHNAPNYPDCYPRTPTPPLPYPHTSSSECLPLECLPLLYYHLYHPRSSYTQSDPSAPVEALSPYDHKPVPKTSGGYGTLIGPPAPVDYSSPYGYGKSGGGGGGEGSATELSSSIGRLNLEEKEKAPERDSYSYREYF